MKNSLHAQESGIEAAQYIILSTVEAIPNQCGVTAILKLTKGHEDTVTVKHVVKDLELLENEVQRLEALLVVVKDLTQRISNS